MEKGILVIKDLRCLVASCIVVSHHVMKYQTPQIQTFQAESNFVQFLVTSTGEHFL